MSFTGFSKDTVRFFKDLDMNNNKIWFEENRHIYDDIVFPEAQNFVVTMGEKLARISEDINADPRTDKSIFRLHRDTRFSKDKRPYKTHLGILFWEGPFKKIEAPLFYFHLDAQKVFLAAGMHIIPKEFMQTYRDAVVDDQQGAALDKALKEVAKHGDYQPGWEKYKKVPRGYDTAHPRNHLLKLGGIGFSIEMPLRKEIHDERLIDMVFQHFENMSPIYLWLKKIIQTG